TGRPFRATLPGQRTPRYDAVLLGVDRDTAELDDRVACRVDLMFGQGLVEETRGLLEQGLREGRTAARALGYQQVVAALDGEYDLATAAEETVRATRRFVRRQRSWFRRDPRIHWLDGADPELSAAARRLVS
ncbi:tRNA (adenosine(37)-N6)-dimethylallyltransferase, partial [Pseudonocardia pini]|uniref:tRNA (adenosine(37)-N6)-dimethylallyltransferase n=1 Tax=Pseudonocardia pini TaxID=2758030 RepID=UPI002483566F